YDWCQIGRVGPVDLLDGDGRHRCGELARCGVSAHGSPFVFPNRCGLGAGSHALTWFAFPYRPFARYVNLVTDEMTPLKTSTGDLVLAPPVLTVLRGRDVELGAISEQLAGVRAGNGSIILVEGRPG